LLYIFTFTALLRFLFSVPSLFTPWTLLSLSSSYFSLHFMLLPITFKKQRSDFQTKKKAINGSPRFHNNIYSFLASPSTLLSPQTEHYIHHPWGQATSPVCGSMGRIALSMQKALMSLFINGMLNQFETFLCFNSIFTAIIITS
jgi:hypothetical protein